GRAVGPTGRLADRLKDPLVPGPEASPPLTSTDPLRALRGSRRDITGGGTALMHRLPGQPTVCTCLGGSNPNCERSALGAGGVADQSELRAAFDCRRQTARRATPSTREVPGSRTTQRDGAQGRGCR